MTCHDARELFSAEIDGALDAGEAAGLRSHLAGCAECRRELARFRATVAVLQSVEPLRAPPGFVDRVLEAARPPSWAERLRRRLVAPLALRGPIAVTVTVLVAVTAVYLYERTPELQRGFEVAAPVEQFTGRTARPPAAPAPQAMPAPKPAAPAKEHAPARPPAPARQDPVASPAPSQPARDVPATAEEKKKAAAESVADANREVQAQSTQAEARLQAAPPPAAEAERQERAASSPPVPTPTPTPVPPPAAGARARASSEMAKSAPMAAGRVAAPADVEGRLGVTDRAAARLALVELAARLGGVAAPAPGDARGDVVDLVVPAAGYPDLVAGLARLGRWTPVREPAQLPGQVRIVLRLTD